MANTNQENLETALDAVLAEVEGVPTEAAALTADAVDRAVAAAADPCDAWRRIRVGVQQVIRLLDLAGNVFPWAKKAAAVLRVISNLLDRLCSS